MNAPDRNCMYCHQQMSYSKLWTPPDMGGMGYAGEPTNIYMCGPCKSQQDYHLHTGELTYHNFRVGLYWLQFHPKYNHFQLGKDEPDDIGNTETILWLEFLPVHLTPQNTTEERIKTLLIFL